MIRQRKGPSFLVWQLLAALILIALVSFVLLSHEERTESEGQKWYLQQKYGIPADSTNGAGR